MSHPNRLKMTIATIVLQTLPLSYREEARYYFELQTKQGDSIFSTAFDYLLGGIRYRSRKVIFFLNQYLERWVNLVRGMKQIKPKISNIYCGIRSNI